MPGMTAAAGEYTANRVLLNTGVLIGSSLWRILISFGLQVLIAYRLGVQGFGQYTAILAYLNVCQVLCELGLPQLLVRDLSQHPEDRAASFHMALLFQGGAAFLVWGGLSLLTLVLPFGNTTRLALMIVGGTLPFFVVTSVCETLFQASERMELVMKVEMTTNTLIILLSGVVLWAGGNVIHLAAVLVITQAISGTLCLFLLRRSNLLPAVVRGESLGVRNFSPLGVRISPDALWAQMWILIRQARPFYGLALSNVLLQRLDILLLSVLVGDVTTGIYSAAYQVVRVLLILTRTYWQALYPTLSRLRQQSADQYENLAKTALRFGLLALLPAASLSSVIADTLIKLLFRSDEYRLSARIFPILIWTVPLYLLVLFSVNILLVERKPRQSLLILGTHIAALLILLPSLTASAGLSGATIASVTAIFASALYGLLLLYRLDSPLGLPRQTGKLLGVTGLAMLAAYLAQRGVDDSYGWFRAISIGSIVYIVSVYVAGLVTVADFYHIRKAFW